MNLEQRFNISIDDGKVESSISNKDTTIFDVMNFLFKNHTEEMFKNFVRE